MNLGPKSENSGRFPIELFGYGAPLTHYIFFQKIIFHPSKTNINYL